MSDDRYFDKLKMPRSALDAFVKAVPDQVVKEIVADHCRRAAPTPLVPSDSHSSCQGAGRDHGFGWTPGYILCPGFVDHIGERARRLHDPPHAGIGFIWNNMREGFGVSHRANLEPLRQPGRNRKTAIPSRIHPTQRDLIRLNRVLPAGRPYCLEPASRAPGAALLGQHARGVVSFPLRTSHAVHDAGDWVPSQPIAHVLGLCAARISPGPEG